MPLEPDVVLPAAVPLFGALDGRVPAPEAKPPLVDALPPVPHGEWLTLPLDWPLMPEPLLMPVVPVPVELAPVLEFAPPPPPAPPAPPPAPPPPAWAKAKPVLAASKAAVRIARVGRVVRIMSLLGFAPQGANVALRVTFLAEH
jgi:hypothetical protein